MACVINGDGQRPRATEPAMWMVMVEATAEPSGVNATGLKVTVAPGGAPEAVSITSWLKPFHGVMVMTAEAYSPADMVSAGVLAAMPKSGNAVTTKDSGTEVELALQLVSPP